MILSFKKYILNNILKNYILDNISFKNIFIYILNNIIL